MGFKRDEQRNRKPNANVYTSIKLPAKMKQEVTIEKFITDKNISINFFKAKHFF